MNEISNWGIRPAQMLMHPDDFYDILMWGYMQDGLSEDEARDKVEEARAAMQETVTERELEAHREVQAMVAALESL